MKLFGLHIDNYGILHDLTLEGDDFQGEPLVLYGLNEAGKSTLLSFIRGVLFGFKAEGSKAGPVRGGQPGGWLWIEDAGEVFRIQRQGKGDGKVMVELPDVSREGEGFLHNRLLHGISPVLFKNVFAIGIDELRKVEDLKKEEINSYIYGAGTGVKPEKLTQAVNMLSSSTGQLFNPDRRAHKPEINKLLGELDRLDRKIGELEQQPARYWELKAEQAELEEKQKLLLQEMRELELRRKNLEDLLKARSPWVARQNLGSQLKEQKPVENFPVDGIFRLEKFEEQKRERMDALREHELASEDLQKRLAALPVDRDLLEQGIVIRGLDGERMLYAEKLQKLSEEESRSSQLQQQAREQIADLGTGWDEEKVLALDLSLSLRRQVESYGYALRRQEENISGILHDLELTERDYSVKKEALQEINLKLSSLPVYENPWPLPTRVAALEELNVDLQRQNNLQASLDGQRERLAELSSRKASAEKSLQGMKPSKVPVLISLAAVVLGVVGFLLVGSGAAGFFLLAGGVGIAILMYVFFRQLAAENAERRKQSGQEAQNLAKELERVLENISRLEQELKKINLRLDENAARLGLTGGLEVESLPRLRCELNEEEKNHSLREDLKKQAEKAGQSLKDALLSLKRMQEKVRTEQERGNFLAGEWEQWRSQKNFPELSPVDLVSFLGLAEKAKDSLKKLNASRSECAQIKKYVDSYVARVNPVAQAWLKKEVARETALDLVLRLKELLEEEQNKAAAREQAQKELDKVLTEMQATAAGLKEVEDSIQALLSVAQAQNPEEFRVLAGQAAVQEKLKHDMVSLEDQLLLIAGSKGEYEKMVLALENSLRTENEEELKRINTHLQQIEQHINELKDELAEKKMLCAQMEAGEELAKARQKKSMLLEALANKVQDWRVRTLCATLLTLARKKYERERQPGVLLQASRYLSLMTGGRYIRVVAPLDSPDLLEVEQPNGQRVPAQFLSRGAANQLYLALRIALARHYSAIAATLPVILDDVLVDFDPQRLAGSVQVLGEIAADQQVLLFTCHRHILDAIARALPRFKCLDLNEL